jgi:hypothetical protein
MKKTGFLLILGLAVSAFAQQPATSSPFAPDNTAPTNVSFPTERLTMPSAVDQDCAGFISNKRLPNANFIAGGLNTPNTTKFAMDDILYLSGKGYTVGQRYEVVRELQNINRHELFKGQFGIVNAMGQPYAEIGRLRIVDTRSKLAIAQVELACEPIVPGDFAVTYEEKPHIGPHAPMRFDVFFPSNGKTAGRIVLAKDFDGELGTGMKIYMNVGANQGVKVGDYFRAYRPYEQDLENEVDSLSFKASTAEDTQKNPPSFEQKMFTKTSGPQIHVRDLPRRSLGEVVILSSGPTSSTGMIVFALEDIHVGDFVEMDEQQQ